MNLLIGKLQLTLLQPAVGEGWIHSSRKRGTRTGLHVAKRKMNRSKFSLLNLLLVTALIALIVGMTVERRQTNRLKLEKRVLEHELGHIDVGDFEKVAVRRLDQMAANSWRYRVYLPKDAKYRLAIGTLGVDENLEPDLKNIKVNNGNFAWSELNSEGQFIFEFNLMKLGNTWGFTHSTSGYDIASASTTKTILFSESQINHILGVFNANVTRFGNHNPGNNSNPGGMHGPVHVFDQGQTITLYASKHVTTEKVFHEDGPNEEAFIVALVPVDNTPVEGK